MDFFHVTLVAVVFFAIGLATDDLIQIVRERVFGITAPDLKATFDKEVKRIHRLLDAANLETTKAQDANFKLQDELVTMARRNKSIVGWANLLLLRLQRLERDLADYVPEAAKCIQQDPNLDSEDIESILHDYSAEPKKGKE